MAWIETVEMLASHFVQQVKVDADATGGLPARTRHEGGVPANVVHGVRLQSRARGGAIQSVAGRQEGREEELLPGMVVGVAPV